jgi:hypothetical protein
MEPLTFARWRLLADAEATRTAYLAIPAGPPGGCGCAPCRNFAAARDDAYPAAVLDLFRRLGITPVREAEVWHLGRVDGGLHLYGGLLHFVGSIQEGGDALTETGAVDLEPVTGTFAVGFTTRLDLVPASFANVPIVQAESLVQVNFYSQIPWVLAEPEPD